MALTAIVLAAGGLYLHSKSRESAESIENLANRETALAVKDWKACKNKQYGYEAKYPPTWTTFIPVSGGRAPMPCGTENQSQIEFSLSAKGTPVISLEASFESWFYGNTLHSLDDYIASSSLKHRQLEKLMIDGEKAVSEEGKWIYTFHKGDVFRFSFYGVDKETTEQFLSAFRFN